MCTDKMHHIQNLNRVQGRHGRQSGCPSDTQGKMPEETVRCMLRIMAQQSPSASGKRGKDDAKRRATWSPVSTCTRAEKSRDCGHACRLAWSSSTLGWVHPPYTANGLPLTLRFPKTPSQRACSWCAPQQTRCLVRRQRCERHCCSAVCPPRHLSTA